MQMCACAQWNENEQKQMYYVCIVKWRHHTIHTEIENVTFLKCEPEPQTKLHIINAIKQTKRTTYTRSQRKATVNKLLWSYELLRDTCILNTSFACIWTLLDGSVSIQMRIALYHTIDHSSKEDSCQFAHQLQFSLVLANNRIAFDTFELSLEKMETNTIMFNLTSIAAQTNHPMSWWDEP